MSQDPTNASGDSQVLAPAELQGARTPIGRRMAESLREIHRTSAMIGCRADGILQVAEHLETGGQIKPEAFAAYFTLVRKLQGDGPEGCEPLIAVLAESALPKSAGISVRMLGFEDFGRVGTRETRSHFASSSLTFPQMQSVPPAAHARMRRRLSEALALIQSHAPEAWKDFSRITTEIIAAYGSPRGIMTFDGCSSLERYGSILVNMRRRRTPLVLAETLVHESAHSLLFALSCNDHRVLNPRSERYKSPLRLDPRPLDGIYHAVFVLARMHGFVAEVATNPRTTKAMQREARDVLKARYRNFMDGYTVLEEHAKFTETGRALLEDAFDRVASAKKLLQQTLPSENSEQVQNC